MESLRVKYERVPMQRVPAESIEPRRFPRAARLFARRHEAICVAERRFAEPLFFVVE